ncbi:DUF488 domain-containing protein [Dehalogenimonas formicexedens]|uniref:DUF488 domain-containing protein n=1 Tax=Dehalogenimonas formicexedens TaxID=1839801 RepID=UPI00096B7A74|nr:DUF488 domain-containing protein [Dehalogenimonas formicexedens]
MNIKRAYETSEKSDGYRVLVDRLWPCGISKEKAGIDLWLKEVAPSTELRKWFGHDPERWPEFQSKYRTELKNHKDLLEQLKQVEVDHKTMTLVYAARDESRNEAVVLKQVLEGSV